MFTSWTPILALAGSILRCASIRLAYQDIVSLSYVKFKFQSGTCQTKLTQLSETVSRSLRIDVCLQKCSTIKKRCKSRYRLYWVESTIHQQFNLICSVLLQPIPRDTKCCSERRTLLLYCQTEQNIGGVCIRMPDEYFRHVHVILVQYFRCLRTEQSILPSWQTRCCLAKQHYIHPLSVFYT